MPRVESPIASAGRHYPGLSRAARREQKLRSRFKPKSEYKTRRLRLAKHRLRRARYTDSNLPNPGRKQQAYHRAWLALKTDNPSSILRAKWEELYWQIADRCPQHDWSRLWTHYPPSADLTALPEESESTAVQYPTITIPLTQLAPFKLTIHGHKSARPSDPLAERMFRNFGRLLLNYAHWLTQEPPAVMQVYFSNQQLKLIPLVDMGLFRIDAATYRTLADDYEKKSHLSLWYSRKEKGGLTLAEIRHTETQDVIMSITLMPNTGMLADKFTRALYARNEKAYELMDNGRLEICWRGEAVEPLSARKKLESLLVTDPENIPLPAEAAPAPLIAKKTYCNRSQPKCNFF